MLPDFNRLKVFYYIYSHTSVVGASKALNLTQPAVSQQLQKLEEEIQTTLFIRLHKKLVPTEAAKRLFTMVQPFMDNLLEGIDDLRQPIDRPAGLLRIGAPSQFGKEYLPLISHSFRQTYPEVRFSFIFDETALLLELLQGGDLDFVLADVFQPKIQFLKSPRLFSIEPLLEEELTLVCSRDYYEKEIQADHSYEHLISKDYICDRGEMIILSHWFRHHFKNEPKRLNVVMTSNKHEVLLSGLRLGMGLGLTSSHLIYADLTDGSIVPILTGKKNPACWISLVQLQDKIPNLTEKTFLSHLKQEVQQEEVLKRFVNPG